MRLRRYERRSADSRISISATISVIMADDDRPEDEREDMLSVLREFRPYYFWILIVQIVVWGVVVFLSERGNCTEVGPAGCAVAMGLKMSGLVPLMLLTSVILVDIGRYFMVFLRHPREKEIARARAQAEKEIARARAQAYAEGKAQGLAEGRAQAKSSKAQDEVISRGQRGAEERVNGAWEVHLKWSVWNARRIEHERRGEPFDEPPPALDDSNETDDGHQ